MNDRSSRPPALLEHASSACALLAVVGGALVLLGWVLDVEVLRAGWRGLPDVKINTAFALILSGAALWLAACRPIAPARRVAAACCSALVALVGILTVVEYATGASLGIDELIARDSGAVAGVPGRMAAATAGAFAAIGPALLLLSRTRLHGVWPIQVLAAAALMLALPGLAGFALDPEAYRAARLQYTPMALPTALMFVVLAFGILTARQEIPFRQLLASDTIGGLSVRRMLPAALVLPLLFGWLARRGVEQGYVSNVAALSLFATANISVLGMVALWNAAALHANDLARRSDETMRARLAAIVESSNDAIIGKDLQGTIVSWNAAAERLYGYSASEAIGRSIALVADAGGEAEALELVGRVARGETVSQHETRRRRKDGTFVDVSLTLSPILTRRVRSPASRRSRRTSPSASGWSARRAKPSCASAPSSSRRSSASTSSTTADSRT